MSQPSRQQLDLSDPAVEQFAIETGIAKFRVKLCLECKSRFVLEQEVDRMQRAHGAQVRFGRIRQSGRGWIVIGSIGE